jgi:rod shape-determining protein MreC
MRNLINIILKYNFVILFVFIEAISFIILVNRNDYQSSGFFNYSRTIGSYYFKKSNAFKEYMSLREVNRKLMDENADLRSRLPSSYFRIDTSRIEVEDTTFKVHYTYTPAKVINNSTNHQYNYITLDKGREEGIEEGMGVVSSDGIVGMVDAVSEHFSLVISLLNRDFRVSAKIKKNNYFGPLEWSGKNSSTATLNEIPLHVNVKEGDTIVTSGFNSVFPEDVMIGFIEDIKITSGSFYSIRVHLASDFKKLSYVMVVNNLMSEEIDQLESKMKND